MKKVLLLALGILLCAGLAFGQAGYIGLFKDATRTGCSTNITGVATMRVYVFHMLAVQNSASMFGIKTTGLTGNTDTECELVGITYYFTLVIGDPFFSAPYDNDNAGVAIAYGSCMNGPIQLMRLNFSCYGDVPPPCSSLEVVPAPDAPSGTIETVDCADHKLVGNGSLFTINPDGTCVCGEVVPVQESSWGKIKSLYNL
jgi:hypothetical protein